MMMMMIVVVVVVVVVVMMITESICRLCKEYGETIDHLTSGCPNLAKNEYII
jgi:uncharacterized membrane protein